MFGAAGAIIWSATGRLFAPEPLEAVGLGLAVAVGASGRVVRRPLPSASTASNSERTRAVDVEGPIHNRPRALSQRP